MRSLYRPRHAVFGRGPAARRRGLYAFGGCDLECVRDCRAAIRAVDPGPWAIRHEELYSGSRTDVVLQGLTQLPIERIAPVLENLGAPLDYFRTRLFEPAFETEAGELYPKSAVVLSLASDLRRPLYRHRRLGFLADPGAWWFGHDLKDVLARPQTAEWFWRDFRSVGRLTVEESMANLRRIVWVLRRSPGVAVFVLNGRPVEAELEPRRRRLNAALASLARELDLGVVDFDRLPAVAPDLKGFPRALKKPVAARVFELLRERGLVPAKRRRA